MSVKQQYGLWGELGVTWVPSDRCGNFYRPLEWDKKSVTCKCEMCGRIDTMPLAALKANNANNANNGESKMKIEPDVAIEMVTAAKANEWIKCIPDYQRNISERRVRAMVNDLRHGNWNYSTDSIGFDVEGRLINGQHRIVAIAKSGVPCRLIVARNLPAESFFTIDGGQARTTGQRAGYKGYRKQVGMACNVIAKQIQGSPTEVVPLGLLEAVMDKYADYGDCFNFHGTAKGLTATVRAIMLMAAEQGEDIERLNSIPHIISTKLPEAPEEYVVIAWLKALERINQNKGAFGSARQRAEWFYAQKLVYAVSNGIVLKKLLVGDNPKEYYTPSVDW